MDFETQKESKEDDVDISAVDRSGVGATTMALDKDVEAVVWSDDPEKLYFKQMMEAQTMSRVADGKDMDDSLVGINTVNSLMKDGDSWNGGGDAMMASPFSAPPHDFSIVAIEDDLSTIAGDATVDNNIIDIPKPSQPSIPRTRDFKEYTPTKKKKRSDSDEDTQPETPPGMIRVSSRKPKKLDKDGAGDDVDNEEIYDDGKRTKRIFVVAAVLALILVASIGALSAALIKLRQTNQESSGSGSASSANGNLPPGDDPFAPGATALPSGTATKKPISEPGSSPTDTPVAAPVAVNSPTNPPVPATAAPAMVKGQTMAPTIATTTAIAATSAPTQVTVRPTATVLGVDSRANLRTVLALASPESITKIDDVNTPHYQAFEWLANDPEYFTYGEARLIQRWVLAVFFLGVTDGDSGGTNRYMRHRKMEETFFDIKFFKPSTVLTNWMTYTNECTWYSSRPNFVCTSDGLVRSIDVRNGDLVGTLPSELSLLADSLQILFLPGNQFRGTIPKSYGKLTKLERFKMTTNNLVGEIPTEIGKMQALVVLGLGRNNFVGNIPTEIGVLYNLNNIGLEGNFLSGTIPIELGELWLLKSLILEENKLTGTIPEVLGALGDLTTLALSKNDLIGEMPKDVCKLAQKAELESVSTDCYIDCDCCTSCEPEPTPTRAPALAGATSKPTACSNTIYTHLGCYQPNERILASFLNCSPQPDDWVGLLGANQGDLNEAIVWMWSCGTQECARERIGADTVEFNWPLNNGEYRVHLIGRNTGENYASIASSAVFEVSDNCNR